jgi:hypothetical protein
MPFGEAQGFGAGVSLGNHLNVLHISQHGRHTIREKSQIGCDKDGNARIRFHFRFLRQSGRRFLAGPVNGLDNVRNEIGKSCSRVCRDPCGWVSNRQASLPHFDPQSSRSNRASCASDKGTFAGCHESNNRLMAPSIRTFV